MLECSHLSHFVSEHSHLWNVQHLLLVVMHVFNNVLLRKWHFHILEFLKIFHFMYTETHTHSSIDIKILICILRQMCCGSRRFRSLSFFLSSSISISTSFCFIIVNIIIFWGKQNKKTGPISSLRCVSLSLCLLLTITLFLLCVVPFIHAVCSSFAVLHSWDKYKIRISLNCVPNIPTHSAENDQRVKQQEHSNCSINISTTNVRQKIEKRCDTKQKKMRNNDIVQNLILTLEKSRFNSY